jgi:hypothetical protein
MFLMRLLANAQPRSTIIDDNADLQFHLALEWFKNYRFEKESVALGNVKKNDRKPNQCW